jgi:hypothetical protein
MKTMVGYYILWKTPMVKIGKHEPKIYHRGFKTPCWLKDKDNEAQIFSQFAKNASWLFAK